MSASISFLKSNATPWNEVVKSWKETTSTRLKMLKNSQQTVQEWIAMWPGLKSDDGFKLVIKNIVV